MSARGANDLTVAELELPCAGSKNELILRLNESASSGRWTEKQLEIQATESEEGAVSVTASEESTCEIEARQTRHHS